MSSVIANNQNSPYNSSDDDSAQQKLNETTDYLNAMDELKTNRLN